MRTKAAKEAASLLISSGGKEIEGAKAQLSSKYRIPFLRNSEILRFTPKSQPLLRRLLLKSPTRTLSGVSPIAIMPPPMPCPGRCIYCPKGENAPQSYTGFEPATMRAIQCGYSAQKQVKARLSQYSAQGHPADKCHLIIMGGTFLCAPKAVRERFMAGAIGALNGKESKTLRKAIDANESARHRAIGITFETRPDFGMGAHADEMLSMGGTQVELGVQALSGRVYRKVRRGHSVADVARATGALRDRGFKVCYHMMPGLFSTPRQDIAYFRRLFSSPLFRPDMLKIYPVLVLSGTPLHSMWKKGEFAPYTTAQAAKVIAGITRLIPPYVRVSRIQRDIPSPLVAAGVKHSNLRQIVDSILEARGEKCNCIRCREIGSQARKGKRSGKLSPTLCRLDYEASGGREIFLSFEDKGQGALAGFLRLRIPPKPARRELSGSSIVRELHVYGAEAAIGEKDEAKAQHKGLGARLLSEAERITSGEFRLRKISVLSGPGARGYYRKVGYSLCGPYMQKIL
jgi:elongator complex protein 3